jgi:hypothetical protein
MGANHFLDVVPRPMRAAGGDQASILKLRRHGRILYEYGTIGEAVFHHDERFSERRQAVKERTEFRVLCLFILLFLLSGCAPSRVYTEGVLAKDYRVMSTSELQRYAVDLQDEITRVETGGRVPAGQSRENYLSDLRSTRYDVQRQIEDRNLMRSEEQKGRSDQRSPFALP